MSEYVIVGNGVAAAGCIEGIRSADTESSITVISGEDHPVYSRPLISYYLEGRTTIEKMNYRPADFYEKNKVKVIYSRAEHIDSKKQTITLTDKQKLKYDKLCLCTGSSPFVPPFEGLDAVEKKFTFMTMDDSLALEKALNPESRVLIVGAGLIGLKCAEGIAERVGTVTVCDLADRVLSSIMDNECAAVMQAHLEKHGISFMLGDTAVSFDKDKAHMKSGAEVGFDILVLAVGVRAEISLAKEAGCDTDRGIIIDETMLTTVSNIYAAGDCTQGLDSASGEKRVLAILPNAYMQGHCAGVNMAGGKEAVTNAVPMNSIGFFGLHSITAGIYPADSEIYEDHPAGGIKRLYIKNGRLAGYILIGEVDRAGIYTALVREKTPLEEVDTARLRLSPSLAVYKADIRRKKLGGVV
ncbi:FAD-dependent oxidoreductase [Ruminococcus sp.]|uniref:NAD(P)/FAD-dependent oxidoreductase n=1 Tax=Ruminococcus sp. TaxID=41978 RepID=UPI0025E9A66F|nr:FAD-dependent oxidoreductase [Ruminococcus sp.]MBQ8967527.1 NAD(P)/FAD-dependent oxidoreductase [Ruminococcus sp.]